MHTQGRVVYQECKVHIHEVLLVMGIVAFLEVYFLPAGRGLFKCLAYSAATIPAAVLDYHKHRLYDWLVLPVMLMGYGVNLYLQGTASEAIVSSLGGSICLGGMFVLISMLFYGDMGLGDIKFAFALGAWLTWEEAIVAFCLTFYLAFVMVLKEFFAKALGKGSLQKEIPLGPMMAAGAWLTIIFGNSLMKWYGDFL